MSLNSVKTTLTIAGKPCHFVHLKLHQSFNNHHTFEVTINFSELDSAWMANPIKMFQMIGGDVGITMQHTQTGEMNLFAGIITNVAMTGEHATEGNIVVSGCSPTIKLDGMPTMDSFIDFTLKEIVQESIENSGNGAEVNVKPVFDGNISYVSQHNESCFSFLNRLSWLYGEWFGYSGTEIFFGKPDLGDASSITYDTEMTHFDFSASLIPPKVNRFDYLTKQVNEVNTDAPDTVAGVRGYIKVALDQSNKVYTSDATRPLEASILSKKDLDDLVKVDKYRAVSQMLTMRGRTQTCKVKISKLISVGLPSNMDVPLKAVETFLVTEVTHEAHQDGTYFNTFTAIPSEMENIPMQPVKEPIALPQVAWVKSNADEKGRVKVAFQWQKKINKTTNWIKVSTPDAGNSSMFRHNRGFVFIPEEGDEVMINFENGDPNRPYVSSSIFPENTSLGGGENNRLKSIRTRNGHRIEFDDNDEDLNITIKDKNDNIIKLNTNNKSILIQSIESIDIKSKTINLDADDINLSSKNTTLTSRERLALFADEKVSIHSENNVSMESFDLLNISGKESNIKGTSIIDITGNDVNIGAQDETLLSGSTVVINGDSDIKLKSPKIDETPVSQQFPFKETLVKREALATPKTK